MWLIFASNLDTESDCFWCSFLLFWCVCVCASFSWLQFGIIFSISFSLSYRINSYIRIFSSTLTVWTNIRHRIPRITVEGLLSWELDRYQKSARTQVRRRLSRLDHLGPLFSKHQPLASLSQIASLAPILCLTDVSFRLGRFSFPDTLCPLYDSSEYSRAQCLWMPLGICYMRTLPRSFCALYLESAFTKGATSIQLHSIGNGAGWTHNWPATRCKCDPLRTVCGVYHSNCTCEWYDATATWQRVLVHVLARFGTLNRFRVATLPVCPLRPATLTSTRYTLAASCSFWHSWMVSFLALLCHKKSDRLAYCPSHRHSQLLTQFPVPIWPHTLVPLHKFQFDSRRCPGDSWLLATHPQTMTPSDDGP